MERIVFILAFVLAAYAQGQGFNFPTDYIRNSAQGNNVKWEKVEGSPYQYETFKPGKLQINDSIYTAQLRYNIYEDVIEIQEGNQNIFTVLKKAYIKVFIEKEKLGIHEYVLGDRVKQAYFLELTDGANKDDILLLKKLERTFVEAAKATSSYKNGSPPRIIKEQTYYLKIPDKPAELIKLNKRSILSVLGTRDSLVTSYLERNKLKFKKEAEVIDFLDYYNANKK